MNRKLKSALLEKFDTCAQAAAGMGIHPSQLSTLIRRRRRPSVKDLRAIGKILGEDKALELLSAAQSDL